MTKDLNYNVDDTILRKRVHTPIIIRSRSPVSFAYFILVSPHVEVDQLRFEDSETNLPGSFQKTILVLKLCKRKVVIRGRFKKEGDFPKIITQPTLPPRQGGKEAVVHGLRRELKH